MYFKGENNSLHFLSDADIANGGMELLPPGCVEITDAEADAIRAANVASLPNPRVAEIKTRLDQIDVDSIRPLRAVAAGTATDFDRNKLASLDSEAASLRAELKTL